MDKPFFAIKIFLLKNEIRVKELAWFSGLTMTKISQITNGRCIPTALQLRKMVRAFEKLGFNECDLPHCLKPTLAAVQSGQYADEA